MKYLTLAVLSWATLVFSLPVSAGEVSFPVSDVVLLQAPDTDDFRVLVRAGGLESLNPDRVDVANLIIPQLAISEPLPLEAYAITQAWTEGSVTWGEAWAAMGASTPTDRCGQARLARGDGGGRDRAIPVTRYVRSVASPEVSDYGLLLRLPSYALTFSSTDIADLVEQLESARIVVLLSD